MGSAFAQVDSFQSISSFGGLLGWDPIIGYTPEPGRPHGLWKPAAPNQNGRPQSVTTYFGMVKRPGAYVGDTRALNGYLDLIGHRP